MRPSRACPTTARLPSCMNAWTRARLERVANWSPDSRTLRRISTRPGHRPKERPFDRYPLGRYFLTSRSPAAQSWTCTVKPPRSLGNLPYSLAEVSCLSRPSACRSAVGLYGCLRVYFFLVLSLSALCSSLLTQVSRSLPFLHVWLTSFVFTYAGVHLTPTNALHFVDHGKLPALSLDPARSRQRVKREWRGPSMHRSCASRSLRTIGRLAMLYPVVSCGSSPSRGVPSLNFLVGVRPTDARARHCRQNHRNIPRLTKSGGR